jgi:hypothetical protein
MTLPLQFLSINFNPYAPVPNGPFTAPLNFYLQGPYNPLVVGSGLSVDYATSTISATGGGGSTTWATLGDKTGASGPNEIALGLNAGNGQANLAVAIGGAAGENNQGLAAVAFGNSAGQTSQGIGAVAIGAGAGNTTQGDCAVALGQSAGFTNQGANALALGDQAGFTNQAACSIVINASGGPLDNTVSNTTVIKPMRDGGTTGIPAGFKQVAYNPVTGELVYYS